MLRWSFRTIANRIPHLEVCECEVVDHFTKFRREPRQIEKWLRLFLANEVERGLLGSRHDFGERGSNTTTLATTFFVRKVELVFLCHGGEVVIVIKSHGW